MQFRTALSIAACLVLFIGHIAAFSCVTVPLINASDTWSNFVGIASAILFCLTGVGSAIGGCKLLKLSMA